MCDGNMDRTAKSATSDQYSVDAYLQRARALYKQKNYTVCVEVCDKAIKQGWRNGKIFNLKALALAQLKQYDKAMESIHMAIEVEPNNKTFSKNRDILYAKMASSPPQYPTNTVPLSIGENLITSFNFAKNGLVGHWSRYFILMLIGCIFYLPLDPLDSPLGYILLQIPVFILFGYQVKIFKGGDTAPELVGYGQMLIDGIKLFIIIFVYVFLGVVILIFLMLLLEFDLFNETLGDTIPILITMAPGLILSMVGGIRFAKTDKFGEGFNFRAVFATIKEIGWVHYILSVIVFVIIFAPDILFPENIPNWILTPIDPFLLLWSGKFAENLYSCA